MSNLPLQIKKRFPQNARLGIKSSLSNIRRVISLVYTLYVANDRKCKIDYSEEYLDGGATKIRLKDTYKSFVNSFFPDGNADVIIAVNPLITSQLEPLQVGLELVFQLGKISFVSGKASSAERTGGSRYAKSITFSSNIIFLDAFFSALTEETRNQILVAWMKNESSGTDADTHLCNILTALTESLKMSVDDGSGDIVFEQEGIYSQLLSGTNVIGKDVHEDVGPLRIYKSFIKEDLHPYISFANNDFSLKVSNDSLTNYLSLVSTTLDLKNSDIPEESANRTESHTEITGTAQVIYYGCPGTGKSHEVKSITEGEKGKKIIWYELPTEDNKECKKVDYEPDDEQKKHLSNNIFRTTFHPDYDYATFVGCYKPCKDSSNHLDYSFVPQVFTNAYIAAFRHPEDPIYLIIEEINRGNCAQIFGDLFQLLDRTNGISDYEIKPDTELAKYLASEGVPSESLKLPSNLHIYATMNTSDQSLFPMDSAFKRRWAMEYKPIQYSGSKADAFTFEIAGKKYPWIVFLQMVNDLIIKATNSEDKQMGEFFIKESVTEKEFVNKVMFYLWNDVCKDLYNPKRVLGDYFMRVPPLSNEDKNNYFTFADLFSNKNADSQLLTGFLIYLQTKYKDNHPDSNLTIIE